VERSEERVGSPAVAAEEAAEASTAAGGQAGAGPQLRERAFSTHDLGALRRFVAGWAEIQGLNPEATEELVLAVNELTTNSICYGGGRGTLAVWREADTLVGEVRDTGHIEDPLAGQRRPAADEQSGRGLWLVHQLCDLVQIDSSPAGTSVRVHKRIGGS
jgi:anti-sigma regulatory factor (Ser/Thr protein kinase)